MRINTQSIKELKPCTDRYENWLFNYIGFDGTLEEFFGLTEITHKDKLWVSLRLMDRTSVEAFSLDCAVSAKNYASAYAASAASYASYAAYASASSAAAIENQLEAILWLVDKFENGGEREN
jgi:hypothetical protein